MGLIDLEQQNFSDAEDHLKTALDTWQKLDYKYNEIQVLIYLAEVEITKGNQQQAGVWLDKAEQLLFRYDRAKRFQSLWSRTNEFRRGLNERILTNHGETGLLVAT